MRSLFNPKSGSIFSPPGSSWASSWGRLGGVWGRLGGDLGGSWAVLGRLGGILGRLGSVLVRLGRVLGILSENFRRFHRFYLRKSSLEPLKFKPPLQREYVLRSLRIFEINLPFGSILMPIWLHFGGILTILGASGRLLGRLGGILEASWGRLGASWCVLARLGTSWRVLGRLGAVLEASWAPKTPNINLTRHGTGSAVLYKGSLFVQALWNDFGSQSFLKVPNAPLASLALRGFTRGFLQISLRFR